MKIYISFISVLFLVAFSLTGCEEKLNQSCNQITQNETFKAKIGEVWCLDATDWKITFGPLIEDSRCNAPLINCFWAGRYVMAATFDNGDAVQDTFYAEGNWQDTLYYGNYKIFLEKVYPELNLTAEPLDPSEYSFDVIVR